MNEPYKIPPIAHFIWAGGTKLMVPEGVEIVSEWIKSNETLLGFRANLWVDKVTAGKSLDELVAEYGHLFHEHGITVLSEAEASTRDLSSIRPPPLIIRDIGKLRNEYVAYEIDKLRPNYGSSSDLLRYEILLREGGFYCDCSDVKVGSDNLEKLCVLNFERHVLFLEHKPQKPQASQEELQVFSIPELGNDTFATTSSNPALLQILIMCRKNYALSEELSLKHVFAAHSGNNIKDVTIGRTGPGAVRQTLLDQMRCQEDRGFLIDEKRKIEIHRVRNGSDLNLVTPSSNTGNWLNTRITSYENDPRKAIEAVIKTIEFEVQHLKVLRLDDHINDIVESTGGKINAQQAFEAIEPIIKKNLIKIKYTQLTGQFEETIDYASSKQLANIFDLTREACLQAINAQAYLHDILRAEAHAAVPSNILKLQPHAIRLKMTPECVVIVSQRAGVQEQLCLQIGLGVKYLDYLGRHLDKFKNEDLRRDLKQYLTERLAKYKEYATALNDKVSEENKINIVKIDEALANLGQSPSSTASTSSTFKG